MTKVLRSTIQKEIERLTAVLMGREVDGVRIGMTGITEEWVREAIRTRAEMLTK